MNPRHGLTLGGLTPTAVLVGLMLAGGTFDLLRDEPVAFLQAYLNHDVGGLNMEVAPASPGERVAG